MSVWAEEARRWIGTPFCHGAATRGVGCDCLGLIRGVWQAHLGAEPWCVPRYGRDWWAHLGAAALHDGAARFLRPVVRGGDVALFRLRPDGPVQHAGILSERQGQAHFVHAYARHGVVESPLGEAWARRIAARFSFPERG